MTKIIKRVGEVTVTAYTDGWPMSVYIEAEGSANKDIEIKLSGVEQVTDLQYALDRIQAQLKPYVDRVKQ